uniref:Uncharacterized protein n=1 Tax=Chelonoidis abingdonii TaxID=106734 RepID=A0A8C0GQ64_CHEAB
MAPHRRAGPKAAESGGGSAGTWADRGERSRAHQESRRKWLKVAFLVSSAVLISLLSWSYLVSEDGVAEVLAHYSESLQDRFIEVPCSEDYDSHKRFEGISPPCIIKQKCLQCSNGFYLYAPVPQSQQSPSFQLRKTG